MPASQQSVAEYLSPLMDFAKTMLATKEEQFQEVSLIVVMRK
jgi:hypothetical protein